MRHFLRPLPLFFRQQYWRKCQRGNNNKDYEEKVGGEKFSRRNWAGAQNRRRKKRGVCLFVLEMICPIFGPFYVIVIAPFMMYDIPLKGNPENGLVFLLLDHS